MCAIGSAFRWDEPGEILDSAQLPPLVDVKGTLGPSDDVISDTTRHYPHASKKDFLLRRDITELSSGCLKCHSEVAPAESFQGFVVRR